MARAYNIHIVQDKTTGQILAAFTVKHELQSFLKQIEGWPNPENRHVITTRDGGP